MSRGLKTQLLKSPEQAAAMVRSGALVAFPTETVYGLAADARNAQAIQRLFSAKGRPSDNPLIVHLSDVQHWHLAAERLPHTARIILERFAPGPVTVVVPKHPSIQLAVTAGLSSVGIRIPAHPLARAFLEAAQCPIAAPSANRSGRPSGTTWQSVLEDLEGRIDGILQGETCGIGLESTVVECTAVQPIILRQGAITRAMLQEAVGPVNIYPTSPDVASSEFATPRSGAESGAGEEPNSPGLRHAHYQPQAQVVLVESVDQINRSPMTKSAGTVAETPAAATTAGLPAHAEFDLGEAAYCGMQPHLCPQAFLAYACFCSVEEYARDFYEFLRESDRRGAKTVFVQLSPADGIGAALRDRQYRAAGNVG